MKAEIFNKELEMIEDSEVRDFTRKALEKCPDYFATVAASSTGKYHPTYALGDGGLLRHTKAVARFANHLLSLEQNQKAFNETTRSCIISACLLHDSWKHGSDGSAFTTFDHPLVASEFVAKADIPIDDTKRELISSSISSHMGQWNESKRSKVVLPKPETEVQKFVHMCDYLASRKDIEVLFADDESAVTKVDINTYKLPFGKHKGKTLIEINKEAPDYIEWMRKEGMKEPVSTLIKEL